MIDLLSLMAFHAAYAETIDSDRLEQWPDFFTTDTMYRVTHVENEQENLPAGIIWADSRAMLEDRVAALREGVPGLARSKHLRAPTLPSSVGHSSAAVCERRDGLGHDVLHGGQNHGHG